MLRPVAALFTAALRPRWLGPAAAVLTLAALACAAFLLSGGPPPSAAPLAQRLEFDGDGRLTQSTDAAGRVTRLTVGGDDRSRTWELPDGTKVTEEFDEYGRRSAMTDAAGTVRYEHDGFNRLIAVRRDGMPALKFDYDGRGRLKSLDAGGQVVHYGYDYLGRLAAMETPAGAFTFDYPAADDGGSSIVCRYPNGVRGERRFDPDGRLRAIAYTDAGGGSLAEFTYAYRPDGLVREVHERWRDGERTTTYAYDEVQRLASVADDRGTTTYHYDLVGDRVEVLGPDKASAASRFDWAGRLLEHQGEACENDAAGNLTSWAGATGRARVRFNEENALAEAQADGGPVRYEYDGQGGLLTRALGTSKTTYTVDPRGTAWRPLLADKDGGERTLYLWSGKSPVAAQTGGRVEFYLTDYLGSVRAVTDAQGGLVRRADYDAFGAPRQAPEGQALQPGFAGLFYDPQAALYLTQARVYEPTLGRFLQRDPVHHMPSASQQSLSTYNYCGNDPVNFLDRDGADAEAAATDASRAKGDAIEPDDWFWAVVTIPVTGWIRGSLTAGEALTTLITTAKVNDAGKDIAGAADSTKSTPRRVWSGAKAAWDVYGLKSDFGFGKSLAEKYEEKLGDIAEKNFEKGLEKGLTNEGRDYLNKAFLAESGRYAIKGKEAYDDGKAVVEMFDPKAFEKEDEGGSEAPPASYWTAPERPRRFSAPSFPNWPSAPAPMWPPSIPLSPPPVPIAPDPVEFPTLPSISVPSLAVPPPPGSKGDDTGGLTMIDPGSKTPGDKGVTATITYDENAERLPPLNDGKVGGVRLRGAGAALKDLGPLSGVAVDDNGRLVLLAADAPDIALPPLRLDDVVTVFRCVYDYGEAPSVSIDPDPADEEGVRVHTVRHGKGTEDTYVGWVLFEADRVMKSYDVGMDTVTKNPIHSRVPGYLDKMDLDFLYWDDSHGSSRYRNWIVPAEVVGKRSGNRRLTLLDVPLKVRTERTAVRDGKLVDAPELGHSRAALAFVDWFSKHYDEIAKESYSQPPPESGIENPVPVFEELRRVALMSAVAESLHEQGAAFPAWMRDYPVRPCPTPRTTPPARREESRKVGDTTRSMSIWGGVELAPKDDAKKTVDDAKEANALAPAVLRAVAAAPTLQPVAFTDNGRHYHAVALPGDDTVEPGASILDVVDLVVPAGRGGSLRLTRHASSFFAPSDCLGKAAWTLDLPRLETYTSVTQRTEKTTWTMRGVRLTSPLESVTGEFPDGGKPNKPGPFEYITDFQTDDRIGVSTQQLLFRDGRSWHFTKDGLLAAVKEAPFLQVIRRDARGNVTALEGWLGKTKRAEITLDYDAQGRLEKASGGGAEVRYSYDADGNLAEVKRPDGAVGYRYKDGLVAAVLRDGKAVREFDYGDGGRLRAERGPDGGQFDYAFTAGPDGLTATVKRAGRDGPGAETTYDDGGLVRSRRWPDGSRLEFNRTAAGDVEATLTAPGGVSLSMTRSADGRRQELRTPQGGKVRTEYDEAGRPTALFAGDDAVLKLAYSTDGMLESASDAGTEVRPIYDDGGLRTGVVIAAPGKGADWLEIDCDADGRPVKAFGPHGAPASIAYDDKGRLESVKGPGGEMRVERDAAGRVTSLTGPRGLRWQNTFDADGRLTRLEAARGADADVIEFDGGAPSVLRRFDAAETRLGYEPAGEGRRLRSVRTANGLELTYEYDGSGRLAAVNCGSVYRLEYSYDAAGRLVGWSQRPAADAASWK